MMDDSLYTSMRAAEQHHWWFRGRRQMLRKLIRLAAPPQDATLFDVGCGTGGNLQALSEFGQVFGCEMNPKALKLAESHASATLSAGKLPDNLPFGDRLFDIATLTDVLEHLEDDLSGLKAVAERLKPGGHIAITVPALMWLWTPRDRAHHHYRRYTKGTLRTLIEHSGLRVCEIGYYNTLLFPIAMPVRLWQRWRNQPYTERDMKRPPAPINAMLAGTLGIENHTVGRLPLPIGLSLYALVQRPASSTA